MPQPTDPYNETCKSCPYAQFISQVDEDSDRVKSVRIECDPPMGECRLEVIGDSPFSGRALEALSERNESTIEVNEDIDMSPQSEPW